MELENVIEEEQLENCKKITIDTFNLEDFKKDIQLYLKSINFDKDNFISKFEKNSERTNKVCKKTISLKP